MFFLHSLWLLGFGNVLRARGRRRGAFDGLRPVWSCFDCPPFYAICWFSPYGGFSIQGTMSSNNVSETPGWWTIVRPAASSE